ncbi:alpha/beta hydrolase [Cryptosporangium phraense]|uniref:Carboxylesterase family protein n=1 Tax=Cryptosporangium phraense TaxID=2593070 RepID=A0A545AYA1_9ACTN|nr:alpha/beta hydrolase [Cryptosporangium phraense]TQS46309.1 carboxylesterase family protein [Cryptosporangium phraense]
MPVDQSLVPLLALINSPQIPKLGTGTPTEARANFRAFTVDVRDPATLVPVAAIENVTIDGANGTPLPGRIYRPDVDGPTPTIVFFHGGGFVLGDIDTHDDQCRWLCREVGAVVVSVGYRLAPESPFPGPADDALAAVRWAAARISGLGGDPDRLAVAGDSAGGNLAAVVAQDCRDAGGPALAAQLLLYPAADFAGDYPSMVENAEGYFLTGSDMIWFTTHYVPRDADPADPRLSPLRGRLDGLPPAVVATAGFDPLRDAGDAYASALNEAGVRTIAHRFDGLIHGFFGMGPVSPASEQAVQTICASLRELLA